MAKVEDAASIAVVEEEEDSSSDNDETRTLSQAYRHVFASNRHVARFRPSLYPYVDAPAMVLEDFAGTDPATARVFCVAAGATLVLVLFEPGHRQAHFVDTATLNEDGSLRSIKQSSSSRRRNFPNVFAWVEVHRIQCALVNLVCDEPCFIDRCRGHIYVKNPADAGQLVPLMLRRLPPTSDTPRQDTFE
jgi:hypothetical protein